MRIIKNGKTYNLPADPQAAKQVAQDLFGAAAPALLLVATKDQALKSVDGVHARILRELTGNATIEERDTWQPKGLAAEAHIAGKATPVQDAMLKAEADLVGVTVDQLSGAIVAKAQAYYGLIGMAAGIRAQARAAVKQATKPEHVGVALEAADQGAKQAIGAYMAAQA